MTPRTQWGRPLGDVLAVLALTLLVGVAEQSAFAAMIAFLLFAVMAAGLSWRNR